MKKLTLEDWYELCDYFKKETNTSLSWSIDFYGWDYDDGYALKINREFIKAINDVLEKKEYGNG